MESNGGDSKTSHRLIHIHIHSKEAMADETTVPEPIEVTLCSVEPNNCALEEPVNLSLEFNTNRELLQARWVIMVSSARRLRSLGMLG